MSTPSFRNFEWLNLQPAWYKPEPGKPGDAKVQAEADRVVEQAARRIELREMCNWRVFSKLLALREEYERGMGRKG